MRLIPYRGNDFGVSTLQDRMNRLFDSFFTGGDMGLHGEFVWPPIDVIETPETLQVKAELPGIDPKDIEISVLGDTLTIRGEKTTEKEEKGKTWHRHELTSGKFVRSVTLPADVDADRVEAVDKAGVLTITMPKGERAKARRVTVKAE